MASLFTLGKSILNDLPAPRNINELETMVLTVGEIIIRKIDIIKAGWSTPLIGRGLLRLCSDWWDLDVADASSLRPYRHSLKQEILLVGGFGCLELCIYGIRELA